MSREPDLGLHPRTLRSRPEPKALNHLSHPGAPSVTSFKWVHLRYKHANQEWTLAPWMNRLILPSTGIGNIQDEPKASLKKKKRFIYFREREGGRMHAHKLLSRGKGRGRDSSGRLLEERRAHTELSLTTHEIMTSAQTKSQMLNQPSHQAPWAWSILVPESNEVLTDKTKQKNSKTMMETHQRDTGTTWKSF